jgi:ATP-dependent RNA helicase RhlE
LPHVVNFELPNVDEDYVHRIGRTGRAGRSGEAISLVAPDEEKLLKSIERMTKQKIPDGDLMGFDASTIEAEKPEVRERPDVRNPRNPRGPRGDGPNGSGGGRKDKGKDKGKEKPASNGRGERPAREQKPREGSPAREQQRPAPRAAADRAPDEFLDDDIDNFGNRVDYVPQQKPAAGRGRRPGAPAQGAGSGAPRSGQPQGRQNGPRNSNGSSTGTPPAKRNGPRSGAPRDGQARREDSRPRRPARGDDQPRQEPAVQNPRGNQPKIIHKESKTDRFPTPEQLDQLPSRPRGEKPALLTRNR